MSKLLIPNTTQVPNVLIDAVMRRVSDPALRVLLAIVRKTFGFQKYSDHISLTQLQVLTALSRQGVVNGIKALGGIITIQQGKREGNEYALNLDVATGELVNGIDQSTRLTSQRDSKNTSQRRRHTKLNKNKTNIPESSSNKRSRKLTPADPAALAAFEQFYQAFPRHVAKDEAEKAWLKLSPSAELTTKIMLATALYANQVRDTEKKYIKHPASWLNGRRWEDEPIATTNGNGHVKPAEVKDLGNGMVEIDGRQMERAMYERRFNNGAS